MNSLNYYLDSYPPLNDTTVAAPTYTDPFADITTGWPRILSYKEANFILKIESNLTFVDLNSSCKFLGRTDPNTSLLQLVGYLIQHRGRKKEIVYGLKPLIALLTLKDLLQTIRV